jgi:hypothetical protein
MRGLAGRLGLLLISLLLPLVFLEAVLRWMPGVLPRPVRAVNERVEVAVRWDQGVSGDKELGYKLPPGQSRTVVLDGIETEFRTVRLLHDDIGFRPMGNAAAPPADVALGDSFTACFGVPDESCWVNLLSQRSGRPIANLGVSGYSAIAAARLLRRYGSDFEPRLVLHGIFLNDYTENLQFQAWKKSGADNLRIWYHEQHHGRAGYWLYQRLRIYRLWHSLFRARKSQTYHLEEDGLNLYLSPSGWWKGATRQAMRDQARQLMERVLLEERETAAELNAELVVLLFPFKEGVYWDRLVAQYPKLKDIDIDAPFRALVEFCERQGIRAVDLTSVLRSRAHAGEQVYYSVDGHWNPRGNEVVAEEVFQRLRREKLL